MIATRQTSLSMFRRTGAVLSEHIVEASRVLKLGPLVLVPSQHVLITRTGDQYKALRAPSHSRLPQWIGWAKIFKSFSLQPYSATLPVGSSCRSGDNVGVDMEVRLNCCVNPDSPALLQSDEQNPNTTLVVHADAVCRGAVLDLLLRRDVVDLAALEQTIRDSVQQKADELGVTVQHLEIRRFVAEESECNGHLLTTEMVELANRLQDLENKIQAKSNSSESRDPMQAALNAFQDETTATSLELLSAVLKQPNGPQAASAWFAMRSPSPNSTDSSISSFDKFRSVLKSPLPASHPIANLAPQAIPVNASALDSADSQSAFSVDPDASPSLAAFVTAQQMQQHMTPAQAFAATQRAAANPLQDDLDELDRQYFGVHSKQ